MRIGLVNGSHQSNKNKMVNDKVSWAISWELNNMDMSYIILVHMMKIMN